jgi:hypothetical protein
VDGCRSAASLIDAMSSDSVLPSAYLGEEYGVRRTLASISDLA